MIARFGPALALAVAAGLPLAVLADPLSVFQPQQVRAVSVTAADVKALRALPPLDAFGTVRGTRSPAVEDVGSAAEAAHEAGYALRVPATVPAALATDVHYRVTGRVRTTFTFSGAKARAWARSRKVAFTPVPGGLDGAVYTATLRPIALIEYGAMPRPDESRRRQRTRSFLTVMQAPLPSVSANGAPVATLARWFSEQPGIPPHLAAEVRAIGDPTQTLPIPVRFDKQTAASVDVDGVKGLAIGDETGIGSAVVWTKDGKLYAVGGALAQSELLAVANALK
ncbi:hypothetical protein WPS_08310 [Vulcanimicrobium alpinum]|uniref:Uncharacterized protein n=1 Tax=Vulcanimicrobium alpinum TaxID=3016050 RepID=A0AAN1XTY9_UNVUL|nr:hypothetical protein [Vulcanimicrobium alpinum]BDE05555.1 hypothetical protein WPS_08310 [Vulcanimicrobium alpinum]